MECLPQDRDNFVYQKRYCSRWKYKSQYIEQNKSWKNTAAIPKPFVPWVVKTTINNLDLEKVRPQRAGIIIYTMVQGRVYFGFGLDTKTHDLTDFGGHVIYGKDINVVDGAIREFEEETLGIFTSFTLEDIKYSPTIYDNKNLIIFLHLKINPEEVCRIFNERFKQHISEIPEVCGITWLSWEEFKRSLIRTDVLFSRVRNFLRKAGDFTYLL